MTVRGRANGARPASRESNVGRWWIATLTAALVFTIVAAVIWSPLATVRSVVLTVPVLPIDHEGRGTRGRAEVEPGLSLALFDVKAYKANLAELPWVKSVRVRRFPLGSVRVEVEVRRPVARLACAGRRWEVDEDCVVIRPARKGVALPEIALGDPTPIKLGSQVNVDVVQGALAAAALARDVPGLRPTGIAVDQINGICFNNDDSVAVCLGQARELPYKMALIERIYEQEPAIGGRLKSIDLSCPKAPACTRRASAGTAPSSEATTADAG
jgi:hypothetical protein